MREARMDEINAMIFLLHSEIQKYTKIQSNS